MPDSLKLLAKKWEKPINSVFSKKSISYTLMGVFLLLLLFLAFRVSGARPAKPARPVRPKPVKLAISTQTAPQTIIPLGKDATQAQVRAYIVKEAIESKVDPNLALRIAKAESGLRCDAQNKTSSAGGVFQFINGTFLSTQKRMGITQTLKTKYDCKENIDLAIFLLKKGEYSHWAASAKNWK